MGGRPSLCRPPAQTPRHRPQHCVRDVFVVSWRRVAHGDRKLLTRQAAQAPFTPDAPRSDALSADPQQTLHFYTSPSCTSLHCYVMLHVRPTRRYVTRHVDTRKHSPLPTALRAQPLFQSEFPQQSFMQRGWAPSRHISHLPSLCSGWGGEACFTLHAGCVQLLHKRAASRPQSTTCTV